MERLISFITFINILGENFNTVLELETHLIGLLTFCP